MDFIHPLESPALKEDKFATATSPLNRGTGNYEFIVRTETAVGPTHRRADKYTLVALKQQGSKNEWIKNAQTSPPKT